MNVGYSTSNRDCPHCEKALREAFAVDNRGEEPPVTMTAGCGHVWRRTNWEPKQQLEPVVNE